MPPLVISQGWTKHFDGNIMNKNVNSRVTMTIFFFFLRERKKNSHGQIKTLYNLFLMASIIIIYNLSLYIIIKTFLLPP